MTRRPVEEGTRPDEIIIKAVGDLTYDELIRKMQVDPHLEDL